MVIINWRIPFKDFFIRVIYKIWSLHQHIQQCKLVLRSITYNEHMSRDYAVDIMLDPLFWIADNFARHLGRVFVGCVSLLTAAVVAVAYWIGLPYWWERCPYTTVFLVIFGNWLLVNIVFHYYMAVTTPPGHPPHGTLVAEAVGICKKCITPKPPRTHHCSVCDSCVMAMDHHCPWLNNCVGFYNVRHFFLYMVYTLAGVSFLIIAGFDIGYQVLWINDEGGVFPSTEPDLIGHPVRIDQNGVIVMINDIVEYDSVNIPREHNLPLPTLSEARRIAMNSLKKKCVIFMAGICCSVLIALGFLTVIHFKNISRGETSVESCINEKLKSAHPNYRNPYDFGRKKNWKLFLGLTQGRTFVKHVLWPSAHKPNGSGLTWHTVHDAVEDWP